MRKDVSGGQNSKTPKKMMRKDVSGVGEAQVQKIRKSDEKRRFRRSKFKKFENDEKRRFRRSKVKVQKIRKNDEK